jgi:SAM-dependent methyltransferase
MVALAAAVPAEADERYVAGVGQALPLRSRSVDFVLFLASLHHVPPEQMRVAVAECGRVLRPGGKAVVLEPVGLPGSYFEVVRLEEDEREVQRLAREALAAAPASGLVADAADMFYVARSFADYEQLMAVAVEDPERRTEIVEAAREVTSRMAREAGVAFDDFHFRSICRLEVLHRTHFAEDRPRRGGCASSSVRG